MIKAGSQERQIEDPYCWLMNNTKRLAGRIPYQLLNPTGRSPRMLAMEFAHWTKLALCLSFVCVCVPRAQSLLEWKEWPLPLRPLHVGVMNPVT